jgi:hypothetical protein
MKNINGYELIDDSEDENYTASEIESNSEDDVSLVDEDGDEDENEDEET